MSPDEFNSLLRELDMPVTRLAHLIGMNVRTVRRWAECEQPIPETVARLLRLSASGDCVLEMLEHFASDAADDAA